MVNLLRDVAHQLEQSVRSGIAPEWNDVADFLLDVDDRHHTGDNEDFCASGCFMKGRKFLNTPHHCTCGKYLPCPERSSAESLARKLHGDG